MENTRKKWPLEFKICAVTISNQYKSVLTISQDMGISENSLQHWKKTLQGRKTDPREKIRFRC